MWVAITASKNAPAKRFFSSFKYLLICVQRFFFVELSLCKKQCTNWYHGFFCILLSLHSTSSRSIDRHFFNRENCAKFFIWKETTAAALCYNVIQVYTRDSFTKKKLSPVYKASHLHVFRDQFSVYCWCLA